MFFYASLFLLILLSFFASYYRLIICALYFFSNRCNPNPCEHGGVCKQNWEEFKCDCDKTGYTGAVCHIRKN